MHLVGQAQVNNFAAQSYGQGMFQMSAYLLQTLAREFGQQLRQLPPALPAITAPPPAVAQPAPAVAQPVPGTPCQSLHSSSASSCSGPEFQSEDVGSEPDYMDPNGPNPMDGFTEQEDEEEEEEESSSERLPGRRVTGKQARLCAC
jgi:hypothetical protein